MGMAHSFPRTLDPTPESDLRSLLFVVDGTHDNLNREIEGLSAAALEGLTFSANGLEKARVAYQEALRELGFFIYKHQDLLK